MITVDHPGGATISTRSLVQFLRRAHLALELAGEVEVLLTSDAALKRLNRSFRGKNKPTDVLSFPAEPMPGLPAEHQHAGDLAISIETAARQAKEHGHALATELRILLLHGLLHLAGMDHEADTGEMASREAELRRQLRLPSSLIERTAQAERTQTRAEQPAVASRTMRTHMAKAKRQSGTSAGTRGPR